MIKGKNRVIFTIRASYENLMEVIFLCFFQLILKTALIQEKIEIRRLYHLPYITVFFVFLGSGSVFSQKVLYVSSSGLSTNSGKSIDRPLDLLSAIKLTKPGVRILIKNDGIYDLEWANLKISRSGTKSNPIILEGYLDTPGDLNRDQNDEEALMEACQDKSKNPLLHGSLTSKGSVGFEVFGGYVQIKNLNFSSFCYNIILRGNNNEVSNCSFVKTPESCGAYQSHGVLIHEGAVENEVGYNCFAGIEFAAISLWKGSQNNWIHHNYIRTIGNHLPRSSATSVSYNTAGTDYPIIISDNSTEEVSYTTDNLVEYNHIQWVGIKGRKLHPSHGIDIKGAAKNTVRRNILENCGIEVDFSTAKANEIYENAMVSTEFNPGRNVSIEFQSGPSDNLIYSNFIDGQGYSPAIRMKHSDDGAAEYPKEVGIFKDNYIFGNTFKDCSHIFLFDNAQENEMSVENLTVYRNTFLRPGIPVYARKVKRVNINLSNNIILDPRKVNINDKVTILGEGNLVFPKGNFYLFSRLENTMIESIEFINKNEEWIYRPDIPLSVGKSELTLPKLHQVLLDKIPQLDRYWVGSSGFYLGEIKNVISSSTFSRLFD